jgi:low affinity Fe/Cu permease
MTRWFHAFAQTSARFCAHPVFFLANVLLAVGWQLWTWRQEVDGMTRFLTVLTHLITILVLYTTTHERLAQRLKEDEIVRAIPQARDAFVGVEDCTPEELERLRREGT